jgi:adhesin HecA-like repeat protein
MSTSHQDLAIVTFPVAGAAAGNLTVTGIKVGDVLKSVVGFILVEGAPNTLTILDLTSEFTITAADTINNTGGTASTAGMLFVTYISQDVRGDVLTRN